MTPQEILDRLKTLTGEAEANRFSKFVSKSSDNDCLIWIGSVKGDKGRPAFQMGKKSVYSSRYIYSKLIGDIPDGTMVCHTCDNPLCVNPAHLFLGSAMDNAKDMANKGRGWWQVSSSDEVRERMISAKSIQVESGKVARGSMFRKSNITEADIPIIRSRAANGESQRKLAREYGVGQSNICQIVTRRIWAHVP